jgi:hypothetical protein
MEFDFDLRERSASFARKEERSLSSKEQSFPPEQLICSRKVQVVYYL